MGGACLFMCLCVCPVVFYVAVCLSCCRSFDDAAESYFPTLVVYDRVLSRTCNCPVMFVYNGVCLDHAIVL